MVVQATALLKQFDHTDVELLHWVSLSGGKGFGGGFGGFGGFGGGFGGKGGFGGGFGGFGGGGHGGGFGGGFGGGKHGRGGGKNNLHCKRLSSLSIIMLMMVYCYLSMFLVRCWLWFCNSRTSSS